MESQKAMLSTRDESIRRLLEKVQSRGGMSGRMEEGVRLSHTDARISQLEALLENQDKENTRLKEVRLLGQMCKKKKKKKKA